MLAAVAFYHLRSAETNTLLAILVVLICAVAYYQYAPAPLAVKDTLSLDTADRKEAVSSNFIVSKFPKLRFLPNNSQLMRIATDLRFVRIFDTARFGDLVLHMEKLQKVYMYILSGRYWPPSYIGTFTDLRTSVLEILYSLIHIIPSVLKHTYGLDPYDTIQKNIDEFTALSRKMLGILRAYAKDRGHNIPDTYFHPYEATRENILP
jgi:hypothetical protein